MILNIVSSNIRFDNPKDNEHGWKYRLPILSTIINDLSPTLLGTQEGWQNQQLELAAKLHKLKIVDKHREWIDDRMYPSIWFDPERIDVIDSGDIWLSETPSVPASISFGSAFPRLCTWAICKIIETDTEIFYVNTHLDHLESEPRQQQIQVLLSEVSKIKGDRPLVITGDFNECPTGEVRKIITKQDQLIDPWCSLGKAEEASFHKFGRDIESPARIDWIMHSEEFEAKSIDLIKNSINGIFPSDHYPVVAKLTIG